MEGAMSYAEVWSNLSSIDCSEHVETRKIGNGELSYLSWAWAWGILMEHYPQAQYEYLPTAFIDGPEGPTAEVCVIVRIDDLERHMWLPVMGNRNESVVNPTTRQISDARMRCLVKCLALYGLGHKLYAGEDTPDLDAPMRYLLAHNDAVRDNLPSVMAIKEALAINDYSTAYECWNELEESVQHSLWKAPSKGGIFTTGEIAQFKGAEWGAARRAYHNIADEDVA